MQFILFSNLVAKPVETQGRKALESTTLCNDSPAANLSICADCFLFELVIAKAKAPFPKVRFCPKL